MYIAQEDQALGQPTLQYSTLFFDIMHIFPLLHWRKFFFSAKKPAAILCSLLAQCALYIDKFAMYFVHVHRVARLQQSQKRHFNFRVESRIISCIVSRTISSTVVLRIISFSISDYFV